MPALRLEKNGNRVRWEGGGGVKTPPKHVQIICMPVRSSSGIRKNNMQKNETCFRFLLFQMFKIISFERPVCTENVHIFCAECKKSDLLWLTGEKEGQKERETERKKKVGTEVMREEDTKGNREE